MSVKILNDRQILQKPDDVVYQVSNSEASAFTKCQMNHWFGYILNLKPKRYSDNLSRGIIGHEALAAFYESKKAGLSDAKAEENMNKVIDDYVIQAFRAGDSAAKEMLMGLRELLAVYVEYQVDDEWELLEVEQQHNLHVTESFGYGMRLDLLVRLTKGPRAGEIAIVDHKFVYDFYPADTLRINAQIPKYLATVRADTGLTITHGILNMVRHRTKKGPMTYDEKFRREPIIVSNKRIRNILNEQISASDEIIKRRNLGVDGSKTMALRALNSMVCKNCMFFDPCMSDLDGESIDLMLQENYEENTSYGYNDEKVE